MKRPPAPPPPNPRRSLLSRISLGQFVMVLAGLIAVLLNLAFLQSGDETVRVAVAGQDLSAGTTLEARLLDLVEVGDAGALADGLILEDALDSIIGMDLNRPVAKNEPIRRSDVRFESGDSALREMAIEIDRGRAAGGRLASGDLVDLIVTIDSTSQYLAAGIEVIEIRDDGDGLGSTDGYTVIVAVDDRTALAIAGADVGGVVHLTRSTGSAPPVSGSVVVDSLPPQ